MNMVKILNQILFPQILAFIDFITDFEIAGIFRLIFDLIIGSNDLVVNCVIFRPLGAVLRAGIPRDFKNINMLNHHAKKESIPSLNKIS